MELLDNPDLVLKPISVDKLVEYHPALRPIVIDGLLRKGETANIIAGPKLGKSFLAGNLAWCVASGRPWLMHDVRQGRVLIIDNELHVETLAHRLNHMADELHVAWNERSLVDVISLRGQNVDIHNLSLRLAEIQPAYYALVVLDALYRTIPTGISENDNAAMMAIYNQLDSYAARWDSAIAVIHHSSKGQQGDKAVTDVGAGAGAISRAADTHISVRPHEEDGLVVMEAVTRSFKSPEPISLKFEWPLWYAVTVAPAVKRAVRQPKEKQAEDDRVGCQILLDAIPEAPKRIPQNQLFDKSGFGVGKCKRLMGQLMREDTVKVLRRKRGKRLRIYYSKEPSNSGSDSGNASGMT